jgi:cytochrome c
MTLPFLQIGSPQSWKTLLLAASVASLSSIAKADSHTAGDPVAGEQNFSKCKTCHIIEADDGTLIQKGGKVGPNLWGLPGRQAGGAEGFKSSKSLAAAGEAGLIWSAETFAAFVADPSGYLKEVLEDPKAKSKKSLRYRDDPADLWAYLVSVSPAADTKLTDN